MKLPAIWPLKFLDLRRALLLTLEGIRGDPAPVSEGQLDAVAQLVLSMMEAIKEDEAHKP